MFKFFAFSQKAMKSGCVFNTVLKISLKLFMQLLCSTGQKHPIPLLALRTFKTLAKPLRFGKSQDLKRVLQ